MPPLGHFTAAPQGEGGPPLWGGGEERAGSVPSVTRLRAPPAWPAVGVAGLLLLGSAVGVKDDMWAGTPSPVDSAHAPGRPGPLVLLAGSLPLAHATGRSPSRCWSCACCRRWACRRSGGLSRCPWLLVALYTVATRCRPVVSGSAAAGWLALLLGIVVGGRAAERRQRLRLPRGHHGLGDAGLRRGARPGPRGARRTARGGTQLGTGRPDPGRRQGGAGPHRARGARHRGARRLRHRGAGGRRRRVLASRTRHGATS